MFQIWNKCLPFGCLFKISKLNCFWDMTTNKRRSIGKKMSTIISVWIEFMIATRGRLLWNFDKLQFTILFIFSYLFQFSTSFRFWRFEHLWGWFRLSWFIVLNDYSSSEMPIKCISVYVFKYLRTVQFSSSPGYPCDPYMNIYEPIHEHWTDPVRFAHSLS